MSGGGDAFVGAAADICEVEHPCPHCAWWPPEHSALCPALARDALEQSRRDAPCGCGRDYLTVSLEKAHLCPAPGDQSEGDERR